MNKFSKVSILVCTHIHVGADNKSCGGSLSLDLITQLKQQIVAQELDISVREKTCFGCCEDGIVARVYPSKTFFKQLTEHSLVELLDTAKLCVEKEA